MFKELHNKLVKKKLCCKTLWEIFISEPELHFIHSGNI